MALSKPVGTRVVQNIPDIAQHYLVCGTEDCENNFQFYCNPCHRPLCEQCRHEHQKSSETNNHEVVPYRQRKRKLPVEKCKHHPCKDIDMNCEDCQVPLCSRCAIEHHRGHIFVDLETAYSKNFTLCLNEIDNINQYYLQTSEDMKKDIKEDVLKMKAYMDKIRASIKAEAESIKSLVERAMSDNLKQANKMEETLLEKLQSQDKTYEEYNSYLENLLKQLQGYLSFDKVQNNPILFSFSEHLNIKPMPESKKPVYPVFIAGHYGKDDVVKLLGTVTAPNTKLEIRKIKPIQTKYTHSEKPKKQDGEQIVTYVNDYSVPGIKRVYHISLDISRRLWVSDDSGIIIQTDLQGNKLHIIKTSGGDDGYHTITQDGDIIFTDREKNVIKKNDA